MLAVDIASLIVQTKGGLGPESVQQLYNTYVFIKVVAIGGYLPVTFGLLTLRMVNKISWNVLFLSIVTIALSIGNVFTKRIFKPSLDDLEFIQTQSVPGGPDGCGGNNLLAWCWTRMGINQHAFSATNTVDGADDILAICLVTLVLLITDHLWRSSDRGSEKIRKVIREHLPRPFYNRLRRLPTVPHWLEASFTPAVLIILIILYIYCFVIYAEDLNWFREYKIYDPDWGFGQVVAVLVWAPPLYQYPWDFFRKQPIEYLAVPC